MRNIHSFRNITLGNGATIVIMVVLTIGGNSPKKLVFIFRLKISLITIRTCGLFSVDYT